MILEDTTEFFSTVAVNPINEEDRIALRKTLKSTFAGLPDRAKFARNGELYDLGIPSLIDKLTTVWTATLVSEVKDLPNLGKGTPDIQLHHRAHHGREWMQKFINTKLGGNDTVSVAFAVVGAIIHANGLHNNAFAGVLCGEPDKLKEPYANKYLSTFNYPMQVSAKQTENLPPSSTKPAWLAASTLTTESVTGDTAYLLLIKKLFKVEITVQPPLTKKKQNRRKKAKPGKRNAGGNKKTDGPKTQPQKKAAPQQGAKVGKPKKPVKLSGKGKKPKGKK